MQGYLQSSYGDSYDDAFEAKNSHLLPPPETMVEVLARCAGAGPALELGIGTGRVARLLAARGIEVDGIEISSAMIEQLRESAAGLPIQVIQGSFADTVPPRRYPLVYCVWTTFPYLTTRQEQEQAFVNVVRALEPGGVFVLETFVHDPGRFTKGQEIKIVELAGDSVTLQFSVHHAETQIIETQRVVIARDGIRLHPGMIRYASPEELDEMAARAGLKLRDRWADWGQESFTAASRRHVSVYTVA